MQMFADYRTLAPLEYKDIFLLVVLRHISELVNNSETKLNPLDLFIAGSHMSLMRRKREILEYYQLCNQI